MDRDSHGAQKREGNVTKCKCGGKEGDSFPRDKNQNKIVAERPVKNSPKESDVLCSVVISLGTSH